MSDIEKTGGLDILNAGSGHIEIRYDTNDTAEIERAKRIIEDMIKRGYSLFIEGEDGALTRVESFDAKSGAYVIAEKGKKRRPHGVKVPMAKAKVTAIGRTSGG